MPIINTAKNTIKIMTIKFVFDSSVGSSELDDYWNETEVFSHPRAFDPLRRRPPNISFVSSTVQTFGRHRPTLVEKPSVYLPILPRVNSKRPV